MIEKRQFQSVLSSVAANAGAALRTLTLDVSHTKQIAIVINLARVSASALTCTARFRAHKGGLWGPMQTISVAGGVGGLEDFNWAKTAEVATVAGTIDCPVDAYQEAEFVIAAPDGGATDLISAQVGGST